VALQDYKGEKVAQWASDGKLSWATAISTVQDFTGNMIRCDTAKHHCSYTPKHRIPFFWQSNRKLCIKTA
jgi:hypothetical protein